jgi:hypothetical protein
MIFLIASAFCFASWAVILICSATGLFLSGDELYDYDET